MMEEGKNIIFIGMRGSGKTTFGRIFAGKIGWTFLDTDPEIESRSGKTIPEIIRDEGWDGFRTRENALCEDLSQMKRAVISLGGGTIMRSENLKLLKKNGFFVFLSLSLEELIARLSGPDNTRPPLKHGLSLRDEMSLVWEERRSVFLAAADFIFRIRNYSKDPGRNSESNAKTLLRLAFLQ